MITISPYLTFNGNCREAMTFYHECFGGELLFQTIGESPLSSNMSERMKNVILHSTLHNESFMIVGTDIVGSESIIKGNSISILVNCSSKEEAKKVYKKLAEGSITGNSLQFTYWGALFGDITDKYDNHWLINFSNK